MSCLAGVANRESLPAEPASPLSDRTLLAGILVVTALVYLPVLRYGFVYDDQGLIVENALVQSWRFVPNYFQGPAWQPLLSDGVANYYRPLALLLFRIDHALFGLHPMGWHTCTLLLHLTTTALVFAITRRVADHSLVAAVAALLFGVHPTHHEVAAWISATSVSLCAVLFLAAFLAYLRSRERRPAGWMSLSTSLYAGAVLANETAMVLPVLIFAHAHLYGVRHSDGAPASFRRRFFPAASRASVYLPVGIVYLAVRLYAVHGFSFFDKAIAAPTLLLTLPSVLFFYLRQWLFPVRLSEFYDLPLQTRWDLLHVAFPMGVLAAAGAALWCFRRRLGPRELAFALLAAAVPLLPAMNFSLLPGGELVHDRYFYLPGWGAALIAGLVARPLFKGRRVFRMPQPLVLALLAMLVPIAYSTANASSYWADDYVLFQHAHAVAPRNVTAQNNYALQLALSGDPGAAMTMLKDLLKDHPDSFWGNYNLGRVLYQTNMLPAAEHYLLQARTIDPTRADPDLQLGMISLRTGRLAESESYFRHALTLRPRDPKFHFALGVALAQREDCQSARSEFSEALSLNPELTRAQEQMDNCGADSAARPAAGPPARPVRVPLAPVKGL
jgi:protein O-mannosyl-transferase